MPGESCLYNTTDHKCSEIDRLDDFQPEWQGRVNVYGCLKQKKIQCIWEKKLVKEKIQCISDKSDVKKMENF